VAGFADTVVVTGLVVEPDDAAAAAAACAWARFRSGVEPELFMMRNFLVLTGVPVGLVEEDAEEELTAMSLTVGLAPPALSEEAPALGDAEIGAALSMIRLPAGVCCWRG